MLPGCSPLPPGHPLIQQPWDSVGDVGPEMNGRCINAEVQRQTAVTVHFSSY